MGGQTREFRMGLRVYYEDTDAAGIVYHANYLKYMERARTEWLRAAGFEQDELAARFGIGFVVRSAEVEFLLPARFNVELTATLSVVRLGRASVDFRQTIVDATGRLICLAAIRVGCVDLHRMAATAMPADIYTGIRNAC